MKFDFKVFANRYGFEVTYNLAYTDKGWYVSHKAINGDSTPNGEPFLTKNLEQDQIAYPSTALTMLEHVWQSLKYEEIDQLEAQQKIDEIADWISNCERQMPKWQGYNC